MYNYRSNILLLLRLAMGFLLLYSGLDKAINGFSATGYLANATSGPFAEIFAAMAGSMVVDLLVVWGEVLIGVALFAGVMLRFAALMGALMMALFYLSALPPEHGPISEHIIYILVLFTLAIYGAGRYWGLDGWLENQKWISEKKYLKYLLG